MRSSATNQKKKQKKTKIRGKKKLYRYNTKWRRLEERKKNRLFFLFSFFFPQRGIKKQNNNVSGLQQRSLCAGLVGACDISHSAKRRDASTPPPPVIIHRRDNFQWFFWNHRLQPIALSFSSSSSFFVCATRQLTRDSCEANGIQHPTRVGGVLTY